MSDESAIEGVHQVPLNIIYCIHTFLCVLVGVIDNKLMELKVLIGFFYLPVGCTYLYIVFGNWNRLPLNLRKPPWAK